MLISATFVEFAIFYLLFHEELKKSYVRNCVNFTAKGQTGHIKEKITVKKAITIEILICDRSVSRFSKVFPEVIHSHLSKINFFVVRITFCVIWTR